MFFGGGGREFIESKSARVSIEKRSLCNLSDVSLARHMSEIPRVLMFLLTRLCALFKLISPGFFRKDFITEDLLDIHEKPFERTKQSRKGCFCATGICKYTVIFKLKIYNLQIFSRPSDIK